VRLADCIIHAANRSLKPWTSSIFYARARAIITRLGATRLEPATITVGATVISDTLPQLAATLAAALGAFDTVNPDGQRLLSQELLNAVFVLMLTTAIL
jgi:hypothetical protein